MRRSRVHGLADLARGSTGKLVDPDDPFAYATHFFCADGVGFERARTPALHRVSGLGPEDTMRICDALGEIALRLERESFASAN
jgi:hypothetical protein